LISEQIRPENNRGPHGVGGGLSKGSAFACQRKPLRLNFSNDAETRQRPQKTIKRAGICAAFSRQSVHIVAVVAQQIGYPQSGRSAQYPAPCIAHRHFNQDTAIGDISDPAAGSCVHGSEVNLL